MIKSLFYRWLYGPLMRIAHRYHWHYAPPIYPEGDTQLWCKWCGFRETIKRRGDKAVVSGDNEPHEPPRTRMGRYMYVPGITGL